MIYYRYVVNNYVFDKNQLIMYYDEVKFVGVFFVFVVVMVGLMFLINFLVNYFELLVDYCQ